MTASQTAQGAQMNRNTINRIYARIRERIAELCEVSSPLKGEIEVDESYFGARRIPGKRGRGARRKTPVFGILERGGCVYTEIVPDGSKSPLQAIIRGKVDLESVIHTDSWPGYNGLVDVGYGHYRVRHHLDEFSVGLNHINGIESFGSYAKRRLAKFNGVDPKRFYYYLKECEFRFNHRGANLYRLLLRHFREKLL